MRDAVPCPSCGGQMSVRAGVCRACHLARTPPPRDRVVWACRDCGTEVGHKQRRCRPCHERVWAPFPRERVKAVIELWADKWRGDRGLGPGDPPGMALVVLAERAGVSRRLIYRIFHGESQSERGTGAFLKLDTVDKLFCAMHCVWLFQVPAEQGGFADIYHSIPYDDEDEELLAA